METLSTESRQNHCPICRKTPRKPTYKCPRGHSVCGSCLTTLSTPCPICLEPIIKPPHRKLPTSQIQTTTKCRYATRGCKYLLEPSDLEPHQLECRFRDFTCEGHDFGCWTCTWKGRYDQIQEHFRNEHEDNTLMLFKTEAMIHVDTTENYRNISLIDYRDGQNFFWYKCKVDTISGKFYSTVQLIGTRQLAQKYCYEFEIFRGPVRKLKVTETCDSDTVDAESIFRNENCVAVSFDALKNYQDEDGNIMFRFRIMSIKKIS